MKRSLPKLLVAVLALFGFASSVLATETVDYDFKLIDPNSINLSLDESGNATIAFVAPEDLMSASVYGIEEYTGGSRYFGFVSSEDNVYTKGSSLTFTRESSESTMTKLTVRVEAENGMMENLEYDVTEDGLVLTSGNNSFFIDQAVVYEYNKTHEGDRAVQQGGAENIIGIFIKDQDSEFIGTQFNIDYTDKKDLPTEEIINYVLAEIDKTKDSIQEKSLLFYDYTGITTPSILDDIKASGKRVIVDEGLYASYIFDGSKITDTNFNITTNISVGYSQNKEKIEALVPDKEKALVIEFAHEGALPTGTSVRVDVSDKYEDGKYLSFYYYNEDKLTLMAQDLEVVNGYVEVPLEHCSEYVFVEQIGKITPQGAEVVPTSTESNEKKSNNAQTAGLDVPFYCGLATLSLVGIITLGVKGRKRIA